MMAKAMKINSRSGRIAALAGAAVVTLLATAPAKADDDWHRGWLHHEWREHEHRWRHHRVERYYAPPARAYYYQTAPTYYYAPPPTTYYYEPAPAYGGLSFGFSVPLR